MTHFILWSLKMQMADTYKLCLKSFYPPQKKKTTKKVKTEKKNTFINSLGLSKICLDMAVLLFLLFLFQEMCLFFHA